MSFVECIESAIKAGEVDSPTGNEIIQAYRDFYTMAEGDGLNPVEASRRATDMIEEYKKSANYGIRRKVDQFLALEKMNRFIDAHPSKNKYTAARDYLDIVNDRVDATFAEILAMLGDVEKSFGSAGFFNYLSGKIDSTVIVDAAQKMMNKQFDGSDSGRTAQGLKRLFDGLADRYIAAGGVMGKIDGYFPSMHVPDKMVKVGVDYDVAKADWIKLTRETYNVRSPKTGKIATEDKVEEILTDIFDNIYTNGRKGNDDLIDAGILPEGGYAAFTEKRNYMRVLEPKDGDSWLKYNTVYGDLENAAENVINHIRFMARDIALMENMGPSPDYGFRYLREKAVSRTRKKSTIRLNAEWKVLRGSGNAYEDGWALKSWTAMTNVTARSAMLGTSGVSAFPDPAFVANAALSTGMSQSSIMKNYVKLLASFEGRLARADAEALISSIDRINGAMYSSVRESGVMQRSGEMGAWLATVTNRASGLYHITNAGKIASRIEVLRNLAKTYKKPWKKLNPLWREQFERYGVTEAHWMKLNELSDDFVDRGFFDINKLAVAGVNGNKELIEVSQAARALGSRVAQMATNEGTLASRAITSGAIFGGSTGGRIIGQALFTFKSFPLSVLVNHTYPAFRNLALGVTRGDGTKLGLGLRQMGNIFVFGSALGALSYGLKQVLKGEEFPSLEDPMTWQKGMFAAGGWGIYQDFLQRDYREYGNSLKADIWGPQIGFLSDTASLAINTSRDSYDRLLGANDAQWNKAQKRFKKDSMRLLGRYMPFANMWFSKLAIERTIGDSMRNIFNIESKKNQKKVMDRVKDNEKESWWSPGEGFE